MVKNIVRKKYGKEEKMKPSLITVTRTIYSDVSLIFFLLDPDYFEFGFGLGCVYICVLCVIS